MIFPLTEDKKELFRTAVLPYFFTKWQEAGGNRYKLEKTLLFLAGFPTLREFLEFISPQTCVIFFHGGIGTRWQESLTREENREIVDKLRISPHLPRGLVKIDNFLPDLPGEKTAIASYNIYAVSRLSDKLIIVHGNGQEELFKKEIIKPLKLIGKTIFVEQELDPETEKPLGHGDALLQLFSKEYNKQVREIISKSKYLVTQFEGLPSRRSTAEISILAMYVMDKYQGKISWLSPTCVLNLPRYPFFLDKQQRITGLCHGKLMVKESITLNGKNIPNNIGLHIIKTADLIPLLSEIEKSSKQKNYKELFSSSKTGEFALDHLMEIIIKKKRLLIFNIAKSDELQNEVKTADRLFKYIADLRRILISEFEPKASTISEIENHMRHLLLVMKKKPHNLILLDPNPLTKGVGAGHSRQIYMMKMFLDACGVSERVIHLVMSNTKKSGFLSRAAFKIYKHIQSRPMLTRIVSNYMNSLGKIESVDKDLMKSDYSEEVMERLTVSTSFNSRLPSIIIATHVVETVTAVNLLKKRQLKGAVIEYIPDPFPSPMQLQAMSSPVTHNNHFIVVHDKYTMDNLFTVRKGIAREVNVFPLGTLSNFRFLLKDKVSGEGKPIHIGIECGGNYLPKYDRIVFEFIRDNAEVIRSGNLKITFHTMYHDKTYMNLINLLKTLNLKYGVGENFRIINSGNSPDPSGEAISSREKYLIGQMDKGWGVPQAVITKGSEVTLEHRGQMLMAVVYGAGHERLDAEAGMKERRAVNLFDVKPRDYLQVIKASLKERNKLNLPKPPFSYAVFAILKYLDSRYFHKNILSKIPGFETTYKS